MFKTTYYIRFFCHVFCITLLIISSSCKNLFNLQNETLISCIVENREPKVVILPSSEPSNISILAHLNGKWLENDWIRMNATNLAMAPVINEDKRWIGFPIKYKGFLHSNLATSVSISVYSPVYLEIFAKCNGKIVLFLNFNITEKNKWHNFSVISKKHNIYILNNKENKTNECNFNYSEVTFRSRKNTYWKEHKYDFMWSNVPSSKPSVLKVPPFRNSCLLLYTSLCIECFLEVTHNNKTINISSTNQEQNIIYEWQTTKIDLNSDYENKFYFTRKKESDGAGHWTIDFKFCDSPDIDYYEISEPKNNSVCKNLTESKLYFDHSSCPVGCFGNNCQFNCTSTFGHEFQHCNKQFFKCDCSWGTSGDFCEKECSDGFWGLSCRNKCPEFCISCNKKTGDCINFQSQRPITFKENDKTNTIYTTFEKNNDTRKSQANTQIIIFSVVPSILLLVLITVTIYIFVKRKKRKLHLNRNTEIELLQTNTITSDEDESKLIKRKNLEIYFNNEFDTNYLIQQFRSFLVINKTSWEALRGINSNKNKDKQHVPFDYNRVVLKKMRGVGSDDYINASYITGYERERAYIAAQSPKFNTVKDFWRMIWQEGIEVIIMVTNFFENDKRMCAEYFPQNKRSIHEYGLINIVFVKQKCFEYYDIQTLKIVYVNSERIVRHVHFKWGSEVKQSLYPNNFMAVLKEFRNNYESTSNPILVHSSFGGNRTGTLILCDLALQMLKVANKIDFNLLAQGLRKQRPKILTTAEHYILAHLIVLNYLYEENSPFETFIDKYNEKLIHEDQINKEKEQLKIQMTYVSKLCKIDEIVTSWNLQNYPQTTNNISSTFVSGYGNYKRYFVIQKPNKISTFGEFWMTVADQIEDADFDNLEESGTSTTTCVFLNKLNENIWPIETECGEYVVKARCLNSIEKSAYFKMKISLLIYKKITLETKHERYISLYELKENNNHSSCFINNLLTIISDTKKISRNKIVLSCSDGVSVCGIFISLSYIIDKYDNELEVDMCNAIRTARRNGIQFINNTKDLKFLYACAREYIKNHESYNVVEK